MTTDLALLASRLPHALRVRAGTSDDIERIVEFQNAYATPGRWIAPASAREMEAANPELKRLVLLVTDGADAIQAIGGVSDGGFWAPPDGSWRGQLRVAPALRRRGIGRALLEQLEEHARRYAASRIVVAVRGDEPEGSRFAEANGYRAYHQRIDAYLELARFDLARFPDPDESASRIGVRLASYAELVTQLGDGLEAFQRALVLMVWTAGRDVPAPVPSSTTPPPFEQAKKMFFSEASLDAGSSIIALRDGRPIGATVTNVRENGVAYTNFTGVSRDERGKGIALLLKLRAIRDLQRRGIRLYGTTNDEANAAMRGINLRLGYTPEAPTIMVEKRLT